VRRPLAALVLTVALAPLPARAESPESPEPTAATVEQSAEPARDAPRDFFLELNLGSFTPEMDGTAGLAGGFRRSRWSFGAELDWLLWRPLGSFSLAFAADYGSVTGQASSDPTTRLTTVPLRLLAVYRFDLFARSGGIPLVPFVKVGLAHTLWWATDGAGGIASLGERRALGGNWGYEVAAGLSLELNFIDPRLGRQLDAKVGIHSVSLQAQYVRITADNFGAPGLNLTANTVQAGLGFEF
jgi:hypothetical protein